MSCLATSVKCEGYTYTIEAEAMDENAIAEAMRQFELFKEKGVISAESFFSDTWKIGDEAHAERNLSFQIDEVHFKRVVESGLGCTLEEFQMAMRVTTTFFFGASTSYLQILCNEMRNVANNFSLTERLVVKPQYEIPIQKFLSFLPGNTVFRDQLYEQLEDAVHIRLRNEKNKQHEARELCYYQSYLKFDRILMAFWEAGSEEEKLLYFPVYLWWNLTTTIPLRVTEFLLLPRNCISYDEGEPMITVRRTKLKGMLFGAEYSLEKDYLQHTYPVSKEIATEIEWYIKATDENYSSPIDTLFCKKTEFNLRGIPLRENNVRYSYSNLAKIFDQFYQDKILSGVGGNILRERSNLPLRNNEIEKISLGDSRHIAMIALMVSGNSEVICQLLAGHDAIETGESYYGNVKTFVDALIWERAKIPFLVEFEYGRNNLPSKSLHVKDGICFSQRACNGDFTDCACAVSDEGMIGDCRSCRFLLIPEGKTFSVSLNNNDDSRLHRAFITIFDAIAKVNQGVGKEGDIGVAISKFQAEANIYAGQKSLKIMENSEIVYG